MGQRMCGIWVLTYCRKGIANLNLVAEVSGHLKFK